MAPPKRPPPRTLTALAKRYVTPNMLRVTLGGEEMADFPPDCAGGYVKLRLPPANGSAKPIVRTYTIRAQREGEIDVDFALHGKTGTGSAGPATEWAVESAMGDTIEVGGPGPAKPLPTDTPFYLIIGDMTSLPAISVNLESLSSDAKGLAFIEVMSEGDKQDLSKPEGVEIVWVVNPQPGIGADAFAKRVRSEDLSVDGLYAWSATEFSTMRAMRAYLREELELGPDRLYISSYWKSGLSEEGHKVIKREDAESLGG